MAKDQPRSKRETYLSLGYKIVELPTVLGRTRFFIRPNHAVPSRDEPRTPRTDGENSVEEEKP